MKYVLLAFVAIIPTCAVAQVKFISPANQAHGTVLPSTCSVGDMFQLTAATAGSQIYSCTAANTWTQQSSDKTPTTRSIATNAPLTGGGNLSADRTIGINNFGGDSGTGGTAGAVPAPAAGDSAAGKFLAAGGGWAVPAGVGTGNANVPTVTVSGATATFFSACATVGCNVSEGNNQIQNFTAANTATAPGSSTGSLYVFWGGTSGCQAVLSGGGSAITFAGAGPCSGVTSTSGSGFPNNATAIISRVDYGSGVWTGFVNYQPTASNPPVISPGTCATQTLAPGTQTINVDTGCIHHAIGSTFYLGGSALSATTLYATIPFACTISSWDIAADAGTATIKLWKVATGTAIPTAANSISTSGFSLATGTAIHSTALTDLSTTSVAANDIIGFRLFAVSGATFVNFVMGCDQ